MEEIMVNEEVIEVAEELVPVRSGKGGVVAAVALGATLAGVAIYKFVIKPLSAKRKAKKEQGQVVGRFIDDEADVIDVEETEE